MTVADRYEGQSAGTCGCGAALVWTQRDGRWSVRHEDEMRALTCSQQDESAEVNALPVR